MGTTEVLLTTPPFHGERIRRNYSTCVGLSYLKSYLQERGLETKVVDPYGRENSIHEMEGILAENRARVYGISGTAYKLPDVKRTINLIKRINPKAKIVLGGWIGFSKRAPRIPQVDYFVRGEGEIISPLLFSRILAGKPIEGLPGVGNQNFPSPQNAPSVKNLDDLLVPDFSDTVLTELSGKKSIDYYSSRGCVNNCSFCSIKLMHSRYRKMSPQKMAHDFAKINEQFPLGLVHLTDDYFDISRLPGLLEELKKQGLDISFQFQTTSRNIVKNHELLKNPQIRNMLSSIHFGPESFSDERLKYINKNTDRETNLRAAEILGDLEISSIAYFIFEREFKDFEKLVRDYSSEHVWPTLARINPLDIMEGIDLEKRGAEEEKTIWHWAFNATMEYFFSQKGRLTCARKIFDRNLITETEEEAKKTLERRKRVKEKIQEAVKNHFQRAMVITANVDAGRLNYNSPDFKIQTEESNALFEDDCKHVWNQVISELREENDTA